MRIGNVGNIRVNPASVKKAKSAGSDSDFSGLLSVGDEKEVVDEIAQSAMASSLNPLLALQDVGMADSLLIAEAKERGIKLLDYLEDIRTGLLLGDIDKDRLEELSELAAEARDQTKDPKLDEILNDIEVRAAVELAKLGK